MNQTREGREGRKTTISCPLNNKSQGELRNGREGEERGGGKKKKRRGGKMRFPSIHRFLQEKNHRRRCTEGKKEENEKKRGKTPVLIYSLYPLLRRARRMRSGKGGREGRGKRGGSVDDRPTSSIARTSPRTKGKRREEKKVKRHAVAVLKLFLQKRVR